MALSGTQVAAMFGVLELKDNMSAGLDNAMNKMHEMSTAGKVMRGGLLVGAAGATALAAGLGVAISEAMEAQVNVAKLEAVIKATGGAAGVTSQRVQEMATRLSRVTRFSDDAIIQGQTMLLTFKEIGEDTFPRATEAMLDVAEMMGTDATSAAVMLGKALNDPIQGVAALRRVGIQMTEAQEDQIKAFMEMNDVASAQAIILGEIEGQFGGIARAAGDTLAGKITIAKNAIMDFAEGIGMKMLPGIEAAVGWLSDSLPRAFDTIAAAWDEGGLIAVGELIVGGIKKGVGDVGAWAQANIIDPLVGAITGFFTRRNPLADFFLAPIDPWQLVGKITYPGMEPGSMPPLKLSPAFSLEGAGSAFDDLVASVPNRLEDLLNNLFGAAVDIGTTVKAKLIDPIVTYLGTVNWAGVGNKLDDLMTKFLDWGGAAYKTAATWIFAKIINPSVIYLGQVDWGAVSNKLSDLLDKFLGWAGAGVSSARDWVVKNIVSPIAMALSGIGPADVIGAGQDLAGFYQGILEALASAVGDAASLVIPWIYRNVMVPFANALMNPDAWALVLKAVGGIILFAISFEQDMGRWVGARIAEIAQGLADAVADPANQLMFVAIGMLIANAIWEGIKQEATSWIVDLGKLVIGGGGGLAPDVTFGDTKGDGGGGGPWWKAPWKLVPKLFDTGGLIKAGEPALIGRGAQPEMFVPTTSGRMYPAGSYGGQTIVIQAVYVQDEDPQRWLDRLTDAARMRGSQVVPVM